jgi:hypothetical protein
MQGYYEKMRKDIKVPRAGFEPKTNGDVSRKTSLLRKIEHP